LQAQARPEITKSYRLTSKKFNHASSLQRAYSAYARSYRIDTAASHTGAAQTAAIVVTRLDGM